MTTTRLAAALLLAVPCAAAPSPDFEALKGRAGAELFGPAFVPARRPAPRSDDPCPRPDPFALTGVNPKTGECVDLGEFRVVNFLEGRPGIGYLSETRSYDAFAARYGFRTGVPSFASAPMVANLKHDGRFWLAQLDLRAVQAVYFQVEEFKITAARERLTDPAVQGLLRAGAAELERHAAAAPAELRSEVERSLRELLDTGVYTAAHGQLRLDFAHPVPLASQEDPARRTAVSSVVLSIHAVAKRYDPVEGMRDVYPLALGAFSAQEKYRSSVTGQGNVFRQYRLNLSRQELTELVTLYLREAERFYRERPYNTFSANCGSIWFETGDAAFMLRERPDAVARARRDPAAALGLSYPKYAQHALAAYGWLADPDDLTGEPWVESPR